jgi:hypothetical protein
LHPTQFCSLDCARDGDSASQSTEFHCARYFWCRDHKLAISAEILPELYHAARDAYYNARDAPLSRTNLMRHTKALLILCPDLLTAWNSRYAMLSACHAMCAWFAFFTFRSIEYCKLHAPEGRNLDSTCFSCCPIGKWCYQRCMISQSSRMNCNCVP